MASDRERQAIDRLDAACRANGRRASGTKMSSADQDIIDTERHLRNAMLRSGIAASLAKMLAKAMAETRESAQGWGAIHCAGLQRHGGLGRMRPPDGDPQLRDTSKLPDDRRGGRAARAGIQAPFSRRS